MDDENSHEKKSRLIQNPSHSCVICRLYKIIVSNANLENTSWFKRKKILKRKGGRESKQAELLNEVNEGERKEGRDSVRG